MRVAESGNRRFLGTMKTILGVFVVALLGMQLAPAEPAKSGVVKVEQAERQLAGGAQLLDVRTAEEWAEGRLKGAKRIDVNEEGFVQKAKAALEEDEPVVVYCRSGKRAAAAAKQLREAGFSEVYEIEGGIVGWQKAGKPVEK